MGHELPWRLWVVLVTFVFAKMVKEKGVESSDDKRVYKRWKF